MAARLTRTDRIHRLVAKTRRRVDKIPEGTRLLRHMPNSMLGVLVREAGYERSSRKLLRSLLVGSATKVSTSARNWGPGQHPKTRIYFFDVERPVKGLQPTRQLFKDEAQLSRFLWLNQDFEVRHQEPANYRPRSATRTGSED